MRRVTVLVPASTANLGPGFDCLGLALGLHNTVQMEALPHGLEVEVTGEGAAGLPGGPDNLILRAAERLFGRAGRRPAGLRLHARNHIPLSSGLGSSAAAVVGGLAAANALIDARLPREELLRMACDLEGHPDNAAPALFGGLVLVAAGAGAGDPPLMRPIPLGDLRQVAVALPALQLSTAQMRQALPEQVPLRDAVFNLGRAALTVEALRGGDYPLLREAMADRLHQPYRKRFIPGFDQAVTAARAAGAAGVALSGAGPALVAFAPSGHDRIARAMAAAFEAAGVPCSSFVLPVDSQGVQVSVAG